MKQTAIIFALLFALLFQSGCATAYVIRNAKEKVAMRKAQGLPEVARENAIRAIQLDNGAAIGIDVSNLEGIKEAGWKAALAAILDAGFVYGARELVKDINDKISETSKTTENNTENITINCPCQNVDIDFNSNGSRNINLTIKEN